MSKIYTIFKDSLSLFKHDRWLIILGLIPIIIGLLSYYFIGQWVFGDIFSLGEEYIRGRVANQSWLKFLTTFLIILLTIFLYFIISWTFVLFISLIASPFNDLMSSRVEKALMHGEYPPLGESLGGLWRKISFTIFNEIKKIIFILIISIFGLVISFFFPPASLIFSSLLVAVSFIDYNWGRHDMKISRCIQSYKKAPLLYFSSGFFFFFLISVPIVNLLMIPLGVVFYARAFAEFELGYKRDYTH
jgi:CysZ protein